MLANQKLKAFVPTLDIKKARHFYKDVLGLILLSEDDYALEFDVNGTPLRVTAVRELQPHPFTVLGWKVVDILSVIKTLVDKGIVFERYDFLQQDLAGIWEAPGGTKVAWFKDPDGNILSLDE